MGLFIFGKPRTTPLTIYSNLVVLAITVKTTPQGLMNFEMNEYVGKVFVNNLLYFESGE